MDENIKDFTVQEDELDIPESEFETAVAESSISVKDAAFDVIAGKYGASYKEGSEKIAGETGLDADEIRKKIDDILNGRW